MSGKSTKWEDTFYVEAYRLAKSHMTDKQIARGLGVGPATVVRWIREKPAFRKAIEDARAELRDKTVNRVMAFRFSDDTLALWEDLWNPLKADDARERYRTLHRRVRMMLFVQALIRWDFNKAMAAETVGVSAKLLQAWNRMPAFKKLIRQAMEAKGDFYEGHLMKLVASGDSPATIFANKTINAKRGYSRPKDVRVAVTGGNKNGETVSSLPLEVRKKMLEMMRSPRPLLEGGTITDAEFEEKK